MAGNKHALTRYRVLDACFSNWMRKYYAEDLIAKSMRPSQNVTRQAKWAYRAALFSMTLMGSPINWNAMLGKKSASKRQS